MSDPHREPVSDSEQETQNAIGNKLPSLSGAIRRINPMSSRTFNARTTHTETSPQVCGLHEASLCCANLTDDDGDVKEVPGAIVAKQECLYLTCRGDEANPEAQIQRSNKKDDYATGYRVIPSGQRREYKDKRGHSHFKPIFKWQQQASDGRWHDVKVWERMVHVECANKLGYFTGVGKTTAFRGDRTEGHAHRLNPTPISGLEELAAMEYEEDAKEGGQ